MPFHFPLQSVLRLRQSLEHQQELRLRAANQLVARARRLIERFDALIEQARARQAHELASGTTSAELRFELQRTAVLAAQRLEAERELGRLEKLREEQQQVFQRARRERETLEILRTAQRRDYNRYRERREQRRLDDLFLQRLDYLRRG